MNAPKLDIAGAKRTLEQHLTTGALVRDIMRVVELCPPSPAETPTGKDAHARWREGLLERLETLEVALRAHFADEEASQAFSGSHPWYRRYEASIVHLKTEHPIMLAALARLRAEAQPKLATVLADDTRAFLAMYEAHEAIENRILNEACKAGAMA